MRFFFNYQVIPQGKSRDYIWICKAYDCDSFWLLRLLITDTARRKLRFQFQAAPKYMEFTRNSSFHLDEEYYTVYMHYKKTATY